MATPKWTLLPGLGTDIGAGPDDIVWLIGTNPVGDASDFGVFFWNGTNWSGVDGGGVRIAVDPGGRPWLLNSAGEIFHRPGESWQRRPGLGNDIGVGSDGSVWVIGTNPVGDAADFGVYRWNGTDWDGVDGGGVRIAVDSEGQPWLVNSVGQIFHRRAESWVLQPGLGKDIGAGAQVFVIGTNPVGTAADFGVYRFVQGPFGGWDRVEGGGVGISVGHEGRPWLVNSVGQIFRGSSDFVVRPPR